MIEFTPQEQPVETAASRRRISIGLPLCSQKNERRFPITPEAAAALVDKGVTVRIESGAAEAIHYSDAAYARAGCEITGRNEALRSDIVVHLGRPEACDIGRMKRGAVLLTLYKALSRNSAAVEALLQRSITALALDMVEDDNGHAPFADILDEIDGCAAVTVAASLQANPVCGKGLLLGGVGGVVPCEVTILGSGRAAVSAARLAIGLGATVRMFDDDLYGLREASSLLDGRAILSAVNAHVIQGAVRSADVIIATPMRAPVVFDADAVGSMKRRVIAFDLNPHPGRVFPSVAMCDLGCDCPDGSAAGAARVCYVNAGCYVPRSASMAVSTAFVVMADDFIRCSTADSIGAAMRMSPGLQPAAMTMFGKVVNRRLGISLGIQALDIAVFLSLS